MTTPRSDDIRDLVEEYALGMLEPAERARFEARLAQDAELRRELDATLETLALLALSRDAATTPALKQRVMARIASGAPASGTATGVIPLAPRSRSSRAVVWLGAGLAASLVVLAKLTFDLGAARRAAQHEAVLVAERSDDLASRDSIIAQLTDSSVEVVTLAATGPAKPIIRAYVNRVRRSVVLSASALPTLPTGRAYQLWFIVNGRPLPSRTFVPDSSGRALLTGVSMPAGTVAATAITQEPAGGSPAPTTPVLFIAKFSTE